MNDNPISVHSEIGALKKVLLHRPGRDLVNNKAEDFDNVWIHDCFYLDYAQREHDAFAQKLRDRGTEVVYLEDLAAQAIDSDPSVKAWFIDRVIAESHITLPVLRQATRERLESASGGSELVQTYMGGLYLRDLELPKGVSPMLLADGKVTKPDDLVLLPLPASYFTRDPMASVGHGVLLHHMFHFQRDREVILYEAIFKFHPEYRETPLWYSHDLPYWIEGGDVLNINAHTLAIGLSERTSSGAIDALAHNIFWGPGESEIEQIFAINIPHGYAYMHLDTVCTQVDYDKFTVYPGIYDSMRMFRLTRGAVEGQVMTEEIDDSLANVLARATGQSSVQLIECGGGDPVEASREQWNDGSNTLALAPGVACVYERNVVTNDELYKAGVELVTIPSEELSRGRGGPRCMSMPFVRDEI